MLLFLFFFADVDVDVVDFVVVFDLHFFTTIKSRAILRENVSFRQKFRSWISIAQQEFSIWRRDGNLIFFSTENVSRACESN